jgi:hypothetical protein
MLHGYVSVENDSTNHIAQLSIGSDLGCSIPLCSKLRSTHPITRVGTQYIGFGSQHAYLFTRARTQEAKGI